MAELYTVNVTNLNLRSALVIDPSNILTTLPSSQVVTRLEIHSEDWWKVSTKVDDQTIEGFVAQRFLTPLETEYKVIADSLNLRSAPIVDPNNLITMLPKSQAVEKLEVAADEDWWKVSTVISGTTQEGYVENRFLAPLNDPFEGQKVVSMDNTSQSFRNKVVQIASRIQVKPIFLMAVMSFETGGTFSPSIRSPASGATGLIQFIAPTAAGLGTSLSALAQMSAIEQLDFVEKYFRPFMDRLQTLEDTYMAVLFPSAVGRGGAHVLFSSPSIEYQQNRGLDINGNGRITVSKAATKVASRII
jgi:Bacterial SH3 domain